ncbi:hypothetical protein [Thermosulfurimonas sp. F29]|uniref:hypothetical protein n=1 Tax=Thermosulfurimonas sp. F29 TaxID=2867247 RepID=UPI001C830DEB|nr:hypothetical protein [Thermosulfurimonas sp. F29]MBX6423357.1 hypothetical protein [Thermosulfurimonas sp. F29]
MARRISFDKALTAAVVVVSAMVIAVIVAVRWFVRDRTVLTAHRALTDAVHLVLGEACRPDLSGDPDRVIVHFRRAEVYWKRGRILCAGEPVVLVKGLTVTIGAQRIRVEANVVRGNALWGEVLPALRFVLERENRGSGLMRLAAVLQTEDRRVRFAGRLSDDEVRLVAGRAGCSSGNAPPAKKRESGEECLKRAVDVFWRALRGENIQGVFVLRDYERPVANGTLRDVPCTYSVEVCRE